MKYLTVFVAMVFAAILIPEEQVQSTVEIVPSPTTTVQDFAPSLAAAEIALSPPSSVPMTMTERRQVIESLRARAAMPPDPPPTTTTTTTEAPTAPPPSLDASTADLKAYVRGQAELKGWTSQSEWEALDWLINRESTWRPTADNPRSTAFGLFQFLRQTASNYGQDHPSLNGVIPSIEDQTRAGLQYIADRYGSPSAAAAFHRSNGYY